MERERLGRGTYVAGCVGRMDMKVICPHHREGDIGEAEFASRVGCRELAGLDQRHGQVRLGLASQHHAGEGRLLVAHGGRVGRGIEIERHDRGRGVERKAGWDGVGRILPALSVARTWIAWVPSAVWSSGSAVVSAEIARGVDIDTSKNDPPSSWPSRDCTPERLSVVTCR